MIKRGNRFKDRTGEKFITNEGYEVIVTHYNSALNLSILYEDGTILNDVNLGALKNGQVRKPFNRIGEEYITNEGFKLKIIQYVSSLNVSVEFEDGNVVHNLQYDNVKRGCVKHLYHRSICDIGYLGDNSKNKRDLLYDKHYRNWFNMISRCYDEKELMKYPTYRDVIVCEEWHNFQNFREWSEINYIDGFYLDKDILIKGNKFYSPDTCCYVPCEINNLFIKSNSIRGTSPIGVHFDKDSGKYRASLKINGKVKGLKRCDTQEEAFLIYKETKENYIKEMADKWKNQLNERVYQAMINYQVEITD